MKPPEKIRKVIVVSQEQTGQANGNPYLSLYRLTLQNRYSDGTTSEQYPYDAVLRKWLDAVVIILTCQINGQLHICLRTAIRPPLLIREQCPVPMNESNLTGVIWELPAGLLEPEDIGEDGILRRAQIEIKEETGYAVPVEQIRLMKGAPFLSPGTMPERLWYTMATVADSTKQGQPSGDGSPVEENADIEWVSLESAIGLCEDGVIEDLKTELGIRRMASLTTTIGNQLGNQ